MKRKEAALILLAVSMLSGCGGEKAVSAPAPTPTEIAVETETETEATETEATKATERKETEAAEQARIIITGNKIDETDLLKTLNPSEGIKQNKPTDKYAYSYLDTFIATLQTYSYFTGADDNQTADIADFYADAWLDMTAEELDSFLKELGNQTGEGINSGLGTDLLDAIAFGDAMTDKINSEIGTEEETGNTDNSGTNDNSGNSGTSGSGNNGKTGTTGTSGSNDSSGNNGKTETTDNVGNGTTGTGDNGLTDAPPEDWTDGNSDESYPSWDDIDTDFGEEAPPSSWNDHSGDGGIIIGY